MQTAFGHKYASLFPDEESLAEWREAWGKGLADMTREELVRGVNALVNEKWPPGIAEFRALCRPGAEPAERKPYVALPRPANDPAKVDAAMRRICEYLPDFAAARVRREAQQ